MAFLRRRHVIETSAWWLVWDHTGRDFHPLAACTAYHAGHPGYDICRLPVDHAGHHSWLLAHPRQRPVPTPV